MHPSSEGFLAPVLGHYIPWLYFSSLWWTKIFWHLSFWGSLMNLIYAFHTDKAPFILGLCFLPFIYGRNLYLLYKHRPLDTPGT